MSARAGLRALPNLISSSRVVLAAGFVMTDRPGARLGLIVIAALTDVLDGWVARHVGGGTRWGALIDPFADRVFALVAVSTFLFTGMIGTLAYFVLISRDLMTAVGFLVARYVSWLRPVEFKARIAGKVVTVLQMIALVAILQQPRWVPALLWAVGVTSLYAIVDYTLALWRARAR